MEVDRKAQVWNVTKERIHYNLYQSEWQIKTGCKDKFNIKIFQSIPMLGIPRQIYIYVMWENHTWPAGAQILAVQFGMHRDPTLEIYRRLILIHPFDTSWHIGFITVPKEKLPSALWFISREFCPTSRGPMIRIVSARSRWVLLISITNATSSSALDTGTSKKSTTESR